MRLMPAMLPAFGSVRRSPTSFARPLSPLAIYGNPNGMKCQSGWLKGNSKQVSYSAATGFSLRLSIHNCIFVWPNVSLRTRSPLRGDSKFGAIRRRRKQNAGNNVPSTFCFNSIKFIFAWKSKVRSWILTLLMQKFII